MSEKPRILASIDWYLPGYKGGGPIRSLANMVQALQDDFSFSVLTSDSDHGSSTPYPDITPDAWTPANGCTVWYCSREKRSYRHMRTLIGGGDWDLLYLNSVFSLRYTIFPLWVAISTHPERPVVLAPRGMLHPGALSLKPRKKKLFLKAFRLLGIHKKLSFHATDAQEVEDIRKVFGEGVKVIEAPNLPQATPASPLPMIAKEPGELRIVFLSRISEKKGVLPLIASLHTQNARITLEVHGPDEEPGYWERCQAAIAQLPPNIVVEKHPPLPPEEVPALLGRHHLFAMPTKGENYGHAIYESLAAGRPVLISDQTPWLDLETHRAGIVLPLSDTGAWVAAIARFAEMGQEEWSQWVTGAHGHALAHAQASTATERTRSMFLDTLAAARAEAVGRKND